MAFNFRCAIVLIAATAIAGTCGSLQSLSVDEAFLYHEVVPDLITITPGNHMQVVYPSGVEVDKGNELTPTQVKDEPSVNWENSADKYYTLALLDPDVPSRESPSNGPVLHWLVGNVQGDDVSTGDVLAEYIGSGPPEGTGFHRYVFLVFEQPGPLDFSYETVIPKTSGENRLQFSMQDFAEKYDLSIDPLAGNLFLAEYDEQVPILMKQMGML